MRFAIRGLWQRYRGEKIAPGTPDFHARVATLRPGDAPEWLEALLKTASRANPQFNVYEWRDYKLLLSPDGHVLESSYGHDFPADVPIDSLHIGMPIDAARLAQPALRYLEPQSFGEGYDLVSDSSAWDLLVDEVSDKVRRITAVPKGRAEERAAKAAAALEGRAKSWRRVQERHRWMMFDDPDALLDAWLVSEGAAAPWSDYPKDINSAYAAWLKQATPDEWHEAARGHNWSYSPAPLFYISRHPDCDLATALYIFYATWPNDYARKNFDPARINNHGTLRLVIGIRDRVLSGFYRRSEIVFDPMRTFGPRWQSVNLGPDFPARLDGREPDPLPIGDGYPIAAWNAVGVTFPDPSISQMPR